MGRGDRRSLSRPPAQASAVNSPAWLPRTGVFAPPPFLFRTLVASSRPPPPRLDAYEGTGANASPIMYVKRALAVRGAWPGGLCFCPGEGAPRRPCCEARGVSPCASLAV